MANHSLPTVSSLYANLVAEFDARIDDALMWMDSAYTTVTNPPTNAIRWDATTKNWKRWDGTAWVDHSTSYALNINGTVGATTPTTGVFTTLSTSGVASLGANSTVGGVAVVTTTAAQTLTNKTLTTPTIASINNTGTLTLPTSTDTLVGRATTDTLTNKTLTAQKVVSGDGIGDVAGLKYVVFTGAASAVNYIGINNSATGVSPAVAAGGTDANINLNLVGKGTGIVQAGGIPIVTTTGTQTLTNKTLTTPTIASIINTGTLTLPTSTDTLVGRSTTDTLANKTLTAPRFASGNYLADANGNELLSLFTTASAVNGLGITNSAAGVAPDLSAIGGDTNIDINIIPKGTGVVTISGAHVVTATATQTLTNKTLTTPTIASIINTGTLTLPTSTDTLVGRATTDTLTNKTLTTPKFASADFLADLNGNELLHFTSVASAVNYLSISNTATTGKPAITAAGNDANVGINLVTKGTGTVSVNGTNIVTNSGSWGISVTGSSGSTSNALTFNSAGAGVASGTTFNGSTAITVSYNTLGATAFGWSLASTASASTARTTLGTDVYKTLPQGTNSGELEVLISGKTINTGPAANSIQVLYNDTAADVTLTQGAGVTMRLDGTVLTGNRTLFRYGKCVLHWVTATTVLVTGSVM